MRLLGISRGQILRRANRSAPGLSRGMARWGAAASIMALTITGAPAVAQAQGGTTSTPVVTVIAGIHGSTELGQHSATNLAAGSATAEALNLPSAVATFDGNVYVASAGDNCVVEIRSDGSIIPIAGTGVAGFNGDGGAATTAELNDPQGLAFDATGDLYIADSGNNLIREVTTAGIIEPVAGTGVAGFSGDGDPAQSTELNFPVGVAVAPNGDVIIGDMQNERVREVTSDGAIQTIAGTGVIGFNGDDQPAVDATVNTPAGIAVAPDGTVYFGDVGNNQVRSIDTHGVIHTVAGDSEPGGYIAGRHTATQSPLWNPYDIALDAAGDLYIADSTNCLVREVDLSANTITDVVGLAPDPVNGPKCGYVGDGLAGSDTRLNRPYGIAVDSSGGIIIADTYNEVVRRYGSPLPAPTRDTVKVTASPNPVPTGVSVVYTANFKPTAPTGLHDGTVRFTDGGVPISGCTALAPGSTCKVTYAVGGAHSIMATYSGDAAFAPVTSPPYVQNVITTVSVSVTSSLDPAPAGSTVAYVAHFTPTTPNGGKVSFSDGRSAIAGCTSLALNTTCNATYTVAGSHSITATYSGDAAFTAATSKAFSEIIAAKGTGPSTGKCPTGVTHLAAGEPWAAAPMVADINGVECAGDWVVTRSGGVTAIGAAPWLGDMSAQVLNAPLVGIASTPDHLGYDLLGADGGIFTFGDAHFYGSTGSMHLNAPVVTMAVTPSGAGYWLTASDGGIFTFGNAHFYGSEGGSHLNKPVVGMSADTKTGGYWLVAADGGIFTFNAPFYGSAGSIPLNQPVVGMSPQPDGRGYRLVAADGGVFDYGDATFYGSLPGEHILNPGITTMAPSIDGAGYYLINGAGSIYAFGDAPNLGNA